MGRCKDLVFRSGAENAVKPITKNKMYNIPCLDEFLAEQESQPLTSSYGDRLEQLPIADKAALLFAASASLAYSYSPNLDVDGAPDNLHLHKQLARLSDEKNGNGIAKAPQKLVGAVKIADSTMLQADVCALIQFLSISIGSEAIEAEDKEETSGAKTNV